MVSSPLSAQQRPLERLNAFFKSPKGRTSMALVAASVVVVAAGAAAYTRYFRTERSTPPAADAPAPAIEVETPKTVASLLDGVQVSEEAAKKRPLAVMVENHPEARPQAGLADANVVWEAIVEGGITRFMALFTHQKAEKVGPVRSARTQYVSWAAGYKALYAHAGGSQGGLALIDQLGSVVTDLPHTAAYFFREPKAGVASEHTLFTTSDKLWEFADEKGASLVADFTPMAFTDEAPLERRPQDANVTVDYSTNTYKAEWLYNRDENRYLRTMAGAPHKDAVTGDQIDAKNVVVLVVDRSYNANTNQGKGEYTFTTEGSGKALVFQNGAFVEGTWRKERKDTMLTLRGADEKEIPLVAGTTWFQVIPPDRLEYVKHTEVPVPPPATT